MNRLFVSCWLIPEWVQKAVRLWKFSGLKISEKARGNNKLNGERIKHWIANGAQVSETLHNMLVNEKIISGKKINVLPKKKPIVKDVKEEAKKKERLNLSR